MKKSSQAARCIECLVEVIILTPMILEIEEKPDKKDKNKEKEKVRDRYEIFIDLLEDDEEDKEIFFELVENGFVGHLRKKMKLSDELMKSKGGVQELFMRLPREGRELVLQIVLSVLQAVKEKRDNNFGVMPPFRPITDEQIRDSRARGTFPIAPKEAVPIEPAGPTTEKDSIPDPAPAIK